MPEYAKTYVGAYLVVGSGREWRVMEQTNGYRMLRKVFTTQAAAVKRASEMDRASAARVDRI